MARLNDLQTSIEELTATVERLATLITGDTARQNEAAKSQTTNGVLWSGTVQLDADGLYQLDALGGTMASAIITNHTAANTAVWAMAGEVDAGSARPGPNRHLIRPGQADQIAVTGSTLGIIGSPGGIIGVQIFTARTER